MGIKKVGIIRGGTGGNYASSLHKGGDIIAHIFENLSHKYKTVDILIDKDGIWHINGVPVSPIDIAHKVDVVWNISKHPSISAILDNFSIPNIENGPFSKILEGNNDILRTHLKNINIQMPKSILIPSYQEDFDGPKEKYAIKKAKEIFEKFPGPWIVKSFTPDSNMGIHLAKTFPELVDSIEDGRIHKKSILIEEFILGKVDAAHSVSLFRNQDIYVFPLNNFKNEEKEKITNLIKDLHKHLGVKHYLKTDFVFHTKRGFFLTNIDFLPDVRPGSHFEEVCNFVGASTHNVFEHIIEKALNK